MKRPTAFIFIESKVNKYCTDNINNAQVKLDFKVNQHGPYKSKILWKVHLLKAH